MKSQHDHMEGRYYFECHCGSSDHLLCVAIEDEYLPDIEFQFISVYNDPWYKRVKSALKFIFFKQKYGIGDSVIFSARNIEALDENDIVLVSNFKMIATIRGVEFPRAVPSTRDLEEVGMVVLVTKPEFININTKDKFI